MRENILILRNVIFLMISVKSKPFKLSCKIPKIIVLLLRKAKYNSIYYQDLEYKPQVGSILLKKK